MTTDPTKNRPAHLWKTTVLTGSFLTLLVASFLVSGGWTLVRAVVGEPDSSESRDHAPVRVERVTLPEKG